MRVLLLHGLESGPQGHKARYLASRFATLTPQMDPSDFAACVAQQAAAVTAFAPDVVVGSSFGGAVAVALLQQGHWRGPTLLLAPAAQKLGLSAALPEGARVLVVHGTGDAVVPVADSRALVAAAASPRVELFEIDDEHRLLGLLEGERLADLVRRAAVSP